MLFAVDLLNITAWNRLSVFPTADVKQVFCRAIYNPGTDTDAYTITVMIMEVRLL